MKSNQESQIMKTTILLLVAFSGLLASAEAHVIEVEVSKLVGVNNETFDGTTEATTEGTIDLTSSSASTTLSPIDTSTDLTQSAASTTGFTLDTTTADGDPIPNDTCDDITSCGEYGIITSPGYPNAYDSNLHCVWTIQTNSDRVIEISFSDMEIVDTYTNCEENYLEIYDCDVLYAGRKFCGSDKPHSFSALCTTVKLTFVSGETPNGKGFSVSWTTKKRCGNNEYMCWDGSCTSLAKKCDGVKDCPDNSDEIECVQPISSNDQCGKTAFPPSFTWDPRIVGGNSANSGSWPWQVAVTGSADNIPFCGGSIIYKNWILTAAHCILENFPLNQYKVHAGKQTLEEQGNQVSSVKAMFPHEKYISADQGYDIALFQLDDPFSFNTRIQPVCISSAAQDVLPGTLVIATGWGYLYVDGFQPDSLYQVRLPIVSNTDCANSYKDVSTIYSSQLCAGDITNGGVDTCQGDSGGPLVTLSNDNSFWHLIGVTSYGVSCADPHYPGIYTKVSSYQDWISGITNGASSIFSTSIILTFLLPAFVFFHDL